MKPKVSFLVNDRAICDAMSDAAKQAVSVRILTAWATTGAGLECFAECRAARCEAIVGTCFAVTEPEAIAEMMQRGFEVRVVEALPEGGTFHPKVYMFGMADGVEVVLLGSANLTDAAFSRNAETMVRMEMTTDEATPLHTLFARFWKMPPAREVTEEWFKKYSCAYRAASQNRARKIAAAERPKHGKAKPKPTPDVLIDRMGLMAADWKEYLKHLRERAEFGSSAIDGKDRSYLRTLSIVTPIVRSGLANAQHEDIGRAMGKTDDCGWLGTVSLIVGEGSQLYKDKKLRARIDAVLAPLKSVKSEQDCIDAARVVFDQLLQISGLGHGFVTRMLAVAKPDRFYSVNGKSDDGLATLLGITKARLKTWEGYEHGLRLIYRTPWYRSARPADARGQRAWDARVALIDAYAYASQPK